MKTRYLIILELSVITHLFENLSLNFNRQKIPLYEKSHFEKLLPEKDLTVVANKNE